MAMRYLEHKPWIVHACNRVVNLKLVQSFLIVVIVVNTLALSADHYTIAPATIAKLNIANTVFSCIFGLEMLLKLLGRLGCASERCWHKFVAAPRLPCPRSFSVCHAVVSFSQVCRSRFPLPCGGLQVQAVVPPSTSPRTLIGSTPPSWCLALLRLPWKVRPCRIRALE